MLSTTLSYAAATLPGSYTNMGTFSSPGYGSSTLAAGNYYYNGMTLSGSYLLNTSGQVNLYVNGNINLSGATAILASAPSNVHIYVMNASAITIGGSGTMSAVLYAPSGTLNISGGSYLLGSAVTNSITLTGSGSIHVDEASTGGSSGSGAGTVSYVQ